MRICSMIGLTRSSMIWSCKKEDVKMELDNGYLTIQAVRSHNQDQTDKNGRYVRRESFSGTCARSFYVGEDVKKEDVHAMAC